VIFAVSKGVTISLHDNELADQKTVDGIL